MERKDYYAVFDIKAYYASFECVERGLDPFTTPLVVTDTTRKESTIVLSVSPYLKDLGVPSRCRRRDLPKNIPNMIYALPQMEKYVKMSAKVVSIFLDFVGIDDIHVYSIDESFIYLTPYLKLYKCTPVELCRKIKKKIYEETGLTLTCGIGNSMFMAKVADDKEAKKNKDNDYIAIWEKEDIPTKLWPIKPLSELWGIASGYQKRLNNLGIYSVYDLAHYDKDILIKLFGVMGEKLYNNANGIDNTNIREKYDPVNKNLSLGQVLMRDYSIEEIPLIIKEMVDDLSQRLRKYHLYTSTIHLSIRYSFSATTETGFSRQCQLMEPTDLNDEIYEGLMYLFKKYIKDKPVRQIGISFGNLTDIKSKQLSLFDDEKKKEKDHNTLLALDEIHQKFGDNSVTRTSALSKSSTAKLRHGQIGGHRR